MIGALAAGIGLTVSCATIAALGNLVEAPRLFLATSMQRPLTVATKSVTAAIRRRFQALARANGERNR